MSSHRSRKAIWSNRLIRHRESSVPSRYNRLRPALRDTSVTAATSSGASDGKIAGFVTDVPVTPSRGAVDFHRSRHLSGMRLAALRRDGFRPVRRSGPRLRAVGMVDTALRSALKGWRSTSSKRQCGGIRFCRLFGAGQLRRVAGRCCPQQSCFFRTSPPAPKATVKRAPLAACVAEVKQYSSGTP
jgi:hypothetical protein